MNIQSVTLSLGLAWISVFALPAHAQSGPPLSPPDLRGTFPDLPKPPVPVDENGNPIPPAQPTAEQVEAERVAREKRAEQQRIDEEMRLAEQTRRAEEERRAAELLAEQKQFHDRVMWAIYIGLGILAVFVGSRLLKK